MKINGKRFFVLDCDERLDVFADLKSAIDILKTIQVDDTEILEFSVAPNGKWAIEPVSWKVIGKLLIGDRNADTQNTP